MSQIFGPVPSRRLGFSLGVDVVPLKTCTYNCIYCQLERTTKKTLRRAEYVTAEVILEELRHVLSLGQQIDYITFSGSGEPTLNAKIGEMIRKIKEMTCIPVAVLTNGSLLYEREVREALSAADLVIPSLDAVSDEAFQRVNRPHGRLKIGTILKGLRIFREIFSGQLWLEIMFVKGINDASEEIERMRGVIGELRPEKIQLNTVIRPPAEVFAQPLTEEELSGIREQLGGNAEIIASFKRKDQSAYKADVEEAVLTLLRRRPVTLSDISEALGVHRNEVVKYLEVLEHDGKIASKIFGGKRYYQSA
ncbi:MAG: radical SAM protein [Candidatus Latescibacterota bacterium]|nr:radical SAM protein [Candidatus Latescibacterota bacterium]OPX22987.1 MAG: hypothetical protein B1H02_05460 [Candidatus Latescibacteria bacterium 4484_107]RKY67453.1 MAG: radical SAM protein [Candidatus Latescibacterota bacterium]